MSVVGSSVCAMGDGGRDEQEPLDADGTERADGSPTPARAPAEAALMCRRSSSAAALAQPDGLACWQGLAWSPLSAGEVRATVREMTALQGRRSLRPGSGLGRDGCPG